MRRSSQKENVPGGGKAPVWKMGERLAWREQKWEQKVMGGGPGRPHRSGELSGAREGLLQGVGPHRS